VVIVGARNNNCIGIAFIDFIPLKALVMFTTKKGSATITSFYLLMLQQ